MNTNKTPDTQSQPKPCGDYNADAAAASQPKGGSFIGLKRGPNEQLPRSAQDKTS